uniref:Secreted protein n=1 Tax=Eutreptiella gymnastica TaxID=73025 RepID=A0A7S1N2Q0_9EUGL
MWPHPPVRGPLLGVVCISFPLATRVPKSTTGTVNHAQQRSLESTTPPPAYPKGPPRQAGDWRRQPQHENCTPSGWPVMYVHRAGLLCAPHRVCSAGTGAPATAGAAFGVYVQRVLRGSRCWLS